MQDDMGEYVKYNGRQVKIGTCEWLYYTSYYKYKDAYDRGRLESLMGSGQVSDYLRIDYGYLFRFPFPDEDRLKFGDFLESFERSATVMLSKAVFDRLHNDNVSEGLHPIGINMQKPVIRAYDGKFCLALVYHNFRDVGSYRIEDEREAGLVVKEIVKNHIAKENDPEKKSFYKAIACRILKGYRIENEKTLTVEQLIGKATGSVEKKIPDKNEEKTIKKQRRHRL